MLGLANLRGTVLPVASLRGLLGAERAGRGARRGRSSSTAPRPSRWPSMPSRRWSTVEADQIETRQAELAAEPGERLKGAFAADGKNAIAKILDIEGADRRRLRAARRGRGRGARWPSLRCRPGRLPERPAATTGRSW